MTDFTTAVLAVVGGALLGLAVTLAFQAAKHEEHVHPVAYCPNVDRRYHVGGIWVQDQVSGYIPCNWATHQLDA